MHFRQLVHSDIEAIARVHQRACVIAYRFMAWDYTEQAVRDWYTEKFATWDWGLVAEDRTVVGFVATWVSHLDQLFVDPEHQGEGLGTALLSTALARMPLPVTLNVFEDNAPARRLYERHGFREIDRFLNETERTVELVYCRDAIGG